MMRMGLLRTVAHVGTRGLATRRVLKSSILAPEILDNLPVFDKYVKSESSDPAAYKRSPVTSAHCIDLLNQQVSTIDSVVISPSGSVVHGKYGDLGSEVNAIPLEYLALLRPAADAAAALRMILANNKHDGHGTILIYGASQASGIAASQLASSAGHAVVAVVGGEHSGNTFLMECLKGIIPEPGTAVPEEYALSKRAFADLVGMISAGKDGIVTHSSEEYLKEFKANLLDYAEMYPDTKPAAVGDEHMEFKYMEKDREMFEENMAAYLEQYPPGSPKMDNAKLDAFFSAEQYQIFRDKFWKQTTDVISGGSESFSAPHLVREQCEHPGELDHRTFPGAGPKFPYSFSILDQFFPEGTEEKTGGPVKGAIIVVTSELKLAAEKIATAKSLRAKGEMLQFLTHAQRAAFGAACSVARQAKKANAPIVVVGGSLPGLESIEASQEDVKETLKAMDIDENGESRLNYFVQVYRANDFPFYADYAVHRATETLAGPRQIIVTK
jgi:hypothetical protein